jgi:hypothetical protein
MIYKYLIIKNKVMSSYWRKIRECQRWNENDDDQKVCWDLFNSKPLPVCLYRINDLYLALQPV